jgi:YD repeat-containing protein
VWSWGLNDHGQLGVTTTSTCSTSNDPCSLVPVQVTGVSNVVALAAGANHSLVARTDSTIWDWGENDDGELGNGTTTPHTAPAQVAGVSGAIVLAAGADHSLAGTRAPAATTNYTYDHLYRLTGVTTTSGATSYTYDPTGNRLSKALGGSTTSDTYDRADRILTAGNTNYTVNNAGNETARGFDSFTYDQANRLTSATISSATSSYVYDGDGKRVSKTVSGTTTSYVYDVGNGLPVLLDDGSRKYVWGDGLAFSVDKTSGAVQVYHADGLGSVRAVTDSSANVVKTYQTDEFGVPVLTQGTSTQPFGFAGEQVDSEDALVYLRARMYDPALAVVC